MVQTSRCLVVSARIACQTKMRLRNKFGATTISTDMVNEKLLVKCLSILNNKYCCCCTCSNGHYQQRGIRRSLGKPLCLRRCVFIRTECGSHMRIVCKIYTYSSSSSLKSRNKSFLHIQRQRVGDSADFLLLYILPK